MIKWKKLGNEGENPKNCHKLNIIIGRLGILKVFRKLKVLFKCV
jgi:hypothetical protein